MLSTVLRIFKSCPKLVQVNLRWAREKCLNHLKQEGVYDVIEWEEEDGDGNGKRRRVMTEGLGRIPKTLMVSERGIPLIGKPFSRRYKYSLPGGTHKGLSLGSGKRNRWRWGGKGRVVDNVVSGGDTHEGVPGTIPVGLEMENIGSFAEVNVDSEKDSGDEEEEGVCTSEKGKEVKSMGLPTPTAN